MTTEQQAAAFNEWMRQYTEEPKAFQREWQTVTEYLAHAQAGQTPSYGEQCVAMLRRCHETLQAKPV